MSKELAPSMGSLSRIQQVFCMPTTTCSQVTYNQETTATSEHSNFRMEGRFVEMEERLRRMTLEMENLNKENKALR